MDPQPFEISWFWDWVPVPGRDRAGDADWSRGVTTLLAEWTGERMVQADAAWTAEFGESLPFGVDALGAALAAGLLERAAALPHGRRLIWGAGFVDGEARWLPVTALAEFHAPRDGDSAYLMELVGAQGRPGDVREPVVDYVSLEHAEGVRVTALAQDEENGLHARVDAAMRLTEPDEVDVLLATRAGGLDQFAVIGQGVEELMGMIATAAADRVLRPVTR